MCSVTFFFPPESCAAYEKMWKNIVEWGRPHMTIWCMHIACWIPKATHTHTNTHTGCVILIAFPQQQWLHELVSLLPYTYIDCLVYHVNVAHLVDCPRAQEVMNGIVI